MRKVSLGIQLAFIAYISLSFSSLYAEDLVFNSFEEAQKAAEERSAEYDRRMKEHLDSVNGAWEKQNEDLGDNAKLDINKITESRETEQTSESDRNSSLQNTVGSNIDRMKQQMINTANANTVGFAGAAAGYSWSVEYKNGKYVLSDTYDQAMFYSGASGSKTSKTETPGNGNGNDDGVKTNSDTDSIPSTSNIGTESVPEIAETEMEPEGTAEIAEVPSSTPDDSPSGSNVTTNPDSDSPNSNESPLVASDRGVELIIQHPITFKEAKFNVSENSEPKVFTLDDDFKIPEDTRVKISAKSDIDRDNTTVTMTITDDEGESEPIDSDSMKNYRHLFRIPSPTKESYSVNIYINEVGKSPKKILQLYVPVTAVDFDSRMISKDFDSRM